MTMTETLKDESEGTGGPSELSAGLCRLGWHRPLRGHQANFRDVVSGKMVFNADCPCGKHWMTDSPAPWFGFKVERHNAELRGRPLADGPA